MGMLPRRGALQRRRDLQSRPARVRRRPTDSSRSTSPSGCSTRTTSISFSCASTTSGWRRRWPHDRRDSWGELHGQDWVDMNQSLFSALWLEKVAVSLAIGLIVMVAALNIVASLILLVMEKNRDIAILKTMGASAKSVTIIFMMQGLIIGVVGTAIGAAAGMRLGDGARSLQADSRVDRRLPGVVHAVPRPACCRISCWWSSPPSSSVSWRPSTRRARRRGSIPRRR